MRDSVETKPQSGRPAKVQPQLPGKLFENPQITSAEMQNFLEKKSKKWPWLFPDALEEKWTAC